MGDQGSVVLLPAFLEGTVGMMHDSILTARH